MTLKARIVFSVIVFALALFGVFWFAGDRDVMPAPTNAASADMNVVSFGSWISNQSQAAIIPHTAVYEHGQQLFLEQGCGACHTIRGLPGAEGKIGPDLTHVGSRRLIASGALKGGLGNIEGWIASAQHIKPGNKMPSFDRLTGRQLRDVAAYLASLK
jgi:cytochrome c oxidase subunit 2